MMEIQKIVVVASLALTGISAPALADTAPARCVFYPTGEDRATLSIPCTFSQRQGYVGIQREDGVRYDLSPVGNEPGNFVDADGKPVYRQSGLGEAGQIFLMGETRLYVYWEMGNLASGESPASTSHPVTYMTPQDDEHIAIQITEGEFFFSGIMERTVDNKFMVSDGKVRVMYDKDTSRVVVINEETGTEFYNYFHSTADEGKL